MKLYSITFPFVAEDLPYPYDGLEPYIDAETLYYHKKIYDNYVEKLNAAIAPFPQYYNWTLEQLLAYIHKLPPLLRDSINKYGGGVYNHILYFQCLGGDGQLNPQTALGRSIEYNFSSFDNFKRLFTQSALERFGSGYTYLVQSFTSIEDIQQKPMTLAIISTANQISPLTFSLYPILCIDVWEHAYYLKHKYVRKDYIQDWFQVISWRQVSTYDTSDLNNIPLPISNTQSTAPIVSYWPNNTI